MNVETAVRTLDVANNDWSKDLDKRQGRTAAELAESASGWAGPRHVVQVGRRTYEHFPPGEGASDSVS